MISTTLTANAMQEYKGMGRFFRLMEATAPVTVRYYLRGAEIAAAEGVSGGYAEKFAEGFDKVTLVSATTQAVQFVARLSSEVAYDAPPTGDVAITNTSGAFDQDTKTVTSASTVLVAANAARRYLLIQNRHATADVYLNLKGVAATVADGVHIPAGASLELSGYVPNNAIEAIGSIASNTSVIVVEA